MRKDDALKLKLEELFSSEITTIESEEENPKVISPKAIVPEAITPKKPSRKSPSRRQDKVDAAVRVLLHKRIQELDCLNDIGYRIDEKPDVDEFLIWVANRIPAAMRDPNIATAAITYNDKVYGDSQAINSSSKIVAGLRIEGELSGYIHIAYQEGKKFLDEESAFIGAVAGRVAGYLENLHLFQRLVMDIANRERAESLAKKRTADLEAVARLSTSISAILEPEPLLQAVVDLSKEMFGLYHTHIYVVNNNTGDLSLAAGAGEIGKKMVSEGWKILKDNEHSIVARAAREKQGIIINDVRNEIDFLPNPLLPDTRSELAIPMLTSGTMLGILDVQSDQVGYFSTEDVSILTALTAQIAIALQNAWRYQETQRQLAEMETLQSMLSRQAWTAYLGRQEREHWGYEYNRSDIQPFSIDSLSIGSNGGSPGRATPIPPYTAPLEVRGETIGRLGVPSEAALTLSEEEQNFLNAVAEQLAQALERARLFEQTQKSALELETVAQVSSASSTMLDPNELLQSVVDLAKNSFGLYHAHAYLLDELETKLILSAGSGEIGRQMVEEGWVIFLEDESIVAQAAMTREGIIVNNVREDPNFLPNPLLPNTSSELAIPMVVGQKLVGVFDVQSDRNNAFTEEDLRTFTTLASQTAVALQNARLFAEQTITVERLRELDHLKTSFLANMSHELRTPLNSILGFTQVILEGIDGPLTDYMVSDLQLIEKNGKHLLHLINEVLDMAKIEAGRMSLTIETVDLKELMEDVFETTSAQARDKAIYLNLETQEDASYVINGDQMRLRQIMLNLVGNSVKFTDTGGITVRLNKEADTVAVQVTDTGIGIPEDKLESIFEAFSQVDTSTTRKAGGTGLGLPISRRLVEMHGGKLWAESRGSGAGTTMHLVLPIHPRSN